MQTESILEKAYDLLKYFMALVDKFPKLFTVVLIQTERVLEKIPEFWKKNTCWYLVFPVTLHLILSLNI